MKKPPSPLPSQQRGERKRKLPETRDILKEKVKRRKALEVPDVVYVYPDLPLVFTLVLQKNFAHLVNSVTVEVLVSKGIAPLASSIACQKVPFAGRVRYFLKNREVISQDPWVLQTIQGYQIDFLQPPEQAFPPSMPQLCLPHINSK